MFFWHSVHWLNPPPLLSTPLYPPTPPLTLTPKDWPTPSSPPSLQVHGLNRGDLHRHLHLRVGRQALVARLRPRGLHLPARRLELAGLCCDRHELRHDRHRSGQLQCAQDVPRVSGAQIRGCDPRAEDDRERHRVLGEEPARCDNPDCVCPRRLCVVRHGATTSRRRTFFKHLTYPFCKKVENGLNCAFKLHHLTPKLVQEKICLLD